MQHDQKIFERAYACGTAYWQNHPDGHYITYDFRCVGSWHNWLSGWYGNGDTRQWANGGSMCWHLGFAKAMCDFGSENSFHMAIDPGFYRFGEYGLGTSVDARSAKCKLNTEGSMAGFSQEYPVGLGAASWSRGGHRMFRTTMSWADCADDEPTATSPATWAVQTAVDREWAHGSFRGIYLGSGSTNAGNPNAPLGVGGLFRSYTLQFDSSGNVIGRPAVGPTYGHSTTHLAANQAAADTTPIPTVAPTCTNLSWTGSTVTCRAAHKYGIHYVRVYNGNGFNAGNPDPSYLGAMQMVWTHPSLRDYVGVPGVNGGNPAPDQVPTLANVADSYQACTFTRSGTSGSWLVLKVVSAKADVGWFRVQHS